MDIGMPTLIEYDGLKSNVDACRSLGLKFIELNMNLPEYQTDALQKIDLSSVADSNGIYFTLHLDENLNVADFNSAVAQAYTDTVKRSIDIALRNGMPVLNMHLARGVYFTLPHAKVYLFEKYSQMYARSYLKFRDVCESMIGDADLKICIENTAGWAEHEKRVLDCLLESDVFALTFDIGHSHCIGDCDEPYILSHANKLFHFHIHDAQNKSAHLPLGDGDVDLTARLALARAHGCRCVAETKTSAGLSQSVLWLKAREIL